MKPKRIVAGLVLLAAWSAAAILFLTRPGARLESTAERLPTPTAGPVVVVPRPDPPDTIRIPDFFSPLPFDAIQPIYSPEFVNAADAPLQDGELVLGIVLDGQAKAYPITVLRLREIVNDELAGIPILATW